MDETMKKLFDQLQNAFETFKEANNERLEQIEARGAADPLLEEKVDRANAAITEIERQISDVKKESQTNIDKLALEFKESGLHANGNPSEVDLKNEARQFFAGIQNKPIDDVQVDVDAYAAYKKAFNMFLRRGDRSMPVDLQNALSVGSDPDGGFWVPASVTNKIIEKLYDTSPMRQIADIVTIGSDRLELPKDVDDASSGGWVGEKQSRSATDTPEVGLHEIPAHEQYAMPKVTQKLLDDAQFPIEAWLTGKIVDKLIRTENTAFVSGSGIVSPRGFTDYTSVATNDATRSWGNLQHVLTGTNDALPDTPDEFIELVGKLKQAYRANAVWTMNRFTHAAIRKLSGGTNDIYYLLPDLAKGSTNNLLGHPIVELDDMSDEGDGNIVAAFGDFKEGYMIVDRIGIRILRDPFTSKPFILLYTTKRTGGDVVNFDAIKLLKCT